MPTTLNPYLNFDGTTAQVIELYTRALGAKAERVMRFADAPQMGVPAEHGQRIMHAQLRIGEGVLMLSDSVPGNGHPLGGNGQVSLQFSDPAELIRRFDALAAGGTVRMPVTDTFWGKFGMLTDAFGVDWMFNCEARS